MEDAKNDEPQSGVLTRESKSDYRELRTRASRSDDEIGDFIRITNNEAAPFKTVSKTDNSLHGGTTSKSMANAENIARIGFYINNFVDI